MLGGVSAPPTQSPLAEEPVTNEATVDVAGRLRFAAARLVRQLRRQDEGGLSATQTAALATIVREGPITLGALAANEGLSKPSITKVVEKLESQGLIGRQAGPDDRRVCLVSATAQGASQLELNRTRRTAYLVARIEALDPHAQARLTAAIDVLEALTEERA